MLALGESFRVERENATLEGLRLVPVDPRAIFLAKAIANAVLLVALGVLLIPVLVALYDVRIVLPGGGSWPWWGSAAWPSRRRGRSMAPSPATPGHGTCSCLSCCSPS